ncbi:MAG: thioredoxin domain-containing protein [Patescibacteria group bacterium]|jgi:protein-disulfide isomerase
MNEQIQPQPAPQVPQTANGFFDGNPRTMYAFGLVTGLALALLLNNFTGISLASNGARTPLPSTPPSQQDPGTPPAAGPLAAVQPNEHIKGDLKKAKVLVVEYSDFQCPFCGQHHPSLQQMVSDYGDQVAWVMRNFPLTSIHPNAVPAANAAECASEQGKYWEFGDVLMENQTSLSDDYYKTVAGNLKLNMKKFNDCYANKKYQSVIDADVDSGSVAGVNGTPATFINGQLVSGAVPYSTLKSMIDAELAK